MQRPATVKLRGTVDGVENLRSRPSGKAPTVVLGRRNVFRSSGFVGRSGGGNVTFEAPIDGDGTFEFAEVPAGTYMVRTIPSAPGPWANVEVEDRDIDDLKITIPPHAEIAGRVIVDNADRMPTAGKIQFLSPNINVGYYATIQPDGSFRITLPFAEYTVGAMDLPIGFVMQATEDLKVDAGSQKELTVQLTTVPLDSIPGVTVSGRTTRPVRNTDVQLLRPGAGRPRHVELQADGTFEFLKVLPGTYSVMLGRVPVLVQAAVTVGDEDVAGIVLAVPPLFEVAGEIEVVDSVGKPLEITPPHMCVRFQSGRGTSAIGLKGGRTFTARLGEGEYEVLVQDLPWDYSVKSIRAENVDLSRDRMKLADGTPVPKAIRVVLESVAVSN